MLINMFPNVAQGACHPTSNRVGMQATPQAT
jgi:hypothetical protein